MKIPKKSLIVGIIAIAALVGAAYAAILLSQDFPAVTVPPAAICSANCGLTNTGHSNLLLLSTPTPISGTAMFGCPGPGNNPAFVVGTAGTFTPTLTVAGASATSMPSPYTGIGIVSGATPGNIQANICSTSTPTPITFGTGMSLAASGYVYCATYAGVSTSGATLPTFTISWSQ